MVLVALSLADPSLEFLRKISSQVIDFGHPVESCPEIIGLLDYSDDSEDSESPRLYITAWQNRLGSIYDELECFLIVQRLLNIILLYVEKFDVRSVMLCPSTYPSNPTPYLYLRNSYINYRYLVERRQSYAIRTQNPTYQVPK